MMMTDEEALEAQERIRVEKAAVEAALRAAVRLSYDEGTVIVATRDLAITLARLPQRRTP